MTGRSKYAPARLDLDWHDEPGYVPQTHQRPGQEAGCSGIGAGPGLQRTRTCRAAATAYLSRLALTLPRILLRLLRPREELAVSLQCNARNGTPVQYGLPLRQALPRVFNSQPG